MTKLYDYSILILMEEKSSFLDQDGTEDIFSAVVEVCIKFRHFQEEGQVMCFTWSAVCILELCHHTLRVSLTLWPACFSIPGWYYASLFNLGNEAYSGQS